MLYHNVWKLSLDDPLAHAAIEAFSKIFGLCSDVNSERDDPFRGGFAPSTSSRSLMLTGWSMEVRGTGDYFVTTFLVMTV